MAQWHERASALKIDGRAFIGGHRVWANSGQQFENVSPVDGPEKVSHIPGVHRDDD